MPKNLVPTCLAIIAGISLIISPLTINSSHAVADGASWSPVPLPSDGEPGKWTLASGADPALLTMTTDGMLYCYATPTGTIDTLFQSKDGGLSWRSIGHVSDAIIAIAVIPEDPATIYYATVSTVYRSTDSGNNFMALPSSPGSAGTGNVAITSISVVHQATGNLVLTGTRNREVGQYGGVYLCDENALSNGWVNTNIGNYDVYSVCFSPNYTSDKAMTAVVSNEVDTIVRSKFADNGWGQIIGDACVYGLTPISTKITFPADYQVTGGFFFTLDTGENRGDAYRITPAFAPFPSTVTTMGIGNEGMVRGMDISSLAIAGNMSMPTLIAGCARQAAVYISRDGGISWSLSQKLPFGQSDTCVVIAPDFTHSQKVYAVTRGTDGGFSVSMDGGQTWSQTSLIDGHITSLVDFAVIPRNREPVLFLITHDGISLKYNLWRSQDGGNHWQRIFANSPPAIDSFTLVRGTTDGSLFLAGESYGIPVIWSSTDDGQTFLARPAPCSIDTWGFLDANRFFIGGYNGVTSVIYSTSNGGINYSQPVEVGMRTLTSIKLSPIYPEDRTMLAGNTGGQVFISTDKGGSFQQLGQQLPVTTGTGKVSLAFDPDFTRNNIIYASVNTKTTSSSKDRIFRLTGQNTTWQSMYSALPDNAIISQIAETDDGTFYAVNGQGVVAADGKGGLLRSLSPTSQPAFELAVRGVNEGVILNGLWTFRNRLWSFDTKNMLLMTFTDSLVLPVILESPPDRESGMNTDIKLEWQASSGAAEYEWQINDEARFSSLQTGYSGTTGETSTGLADLRPGTNYYWRVRVIKPLLSPWSATFSFTTMLGGSNGAPVLSFPAVGSITGISPVFQWQTVPGADRYELLVSDNTDFFTPVICCTGERALSANAWRCDAVLEYDTTYFWKVRACTVTNSSEWSAVSVFTTEQPVPADVPDLTALEPPSEPRITAVISQPLPTASATQINIPEWAILAGLVLLFIIAILLVALVVTLLSSRRL